MADLVECGLAVAAGANDPDLLLRYAGALWTVRDTQAAISALDRAIAADPPLSAFALSKAFAARAICEFQGGNLEQAASDASTSIEIFPAAHPYGLRSEIHLVMGDVQRAIVDAEECVRLDPEDWEGRAWRAMVLREAGRHNEAIEDFTWVIDSGECEKYASELYLGRARAQFALGNAGAAEKDCHACIDLDYHEQAHWPFIVPNRARHAHDAYLVRAEARLALGQNLLALGDCFFAVSLAPAEPAVYGLRARVYQAVGNLPEAMRDMIRVAHLQQAVGDAGTAVGLPTEPVAAAAAN